MKHFPSSADPRLNRLGVVDVGSNSVRLVVFDGKSRSPAYFFNEKVLCGLGRNIHETGRLHPQGRARAMAALKRFRALSDHMALTEITTAATAAVRDAVDGPDFVAEVASETGWHLNVITGDEEARLAAQGVLVGWPDADGIVCDIGGASMELASVKGGAIGARDSSKLGPMHLARESDAEGPSIDVIDARLDALLSGFEAAPDRLFLVGGSWRALAKLDMALAEYPLRVLHSYTPPLKQFSNTLKTAVTLDLEEATELANASSARMSLVPAAALVLQRLLLKLAPKQIVISSYGLREGLLYEEMSDAQRAEDPLIASAKMRESSSARFPGFGEKLAEWVMPIFPEVGPKWSRLIQAACHLHDATWRGHPDYRAEVCFDNATRTDLSGLSHAERIIIALAMMRRYKSKLPLERYESLVALLTEAERQFALRLGAVMRLGAFVAGPTAQSLGRLKLEDGTIIWDLPETSEHLVAEVAQKRFQQLATDLGRAAEIRFS